MTDSSLITQLNNQRGNNFPNARLAGGHLIEAFGLIGFASATPANDSVHRICRIPRGARLADIIAICPAMGTLTANVGLFRTLDRGGADVDEDHYATAVSFAATLNASILPDAEWGTTDRENPIHESLGTLDVGDAEYDVGIKLSAVGSGVNTSRRIAFRVQYVM